MEVDVDGLEVVLAAPDGDAEHEAPARQHVERGGLLGEHRAVGAGGREQDRGREADPLGHRGRRGEGDQRVVARVHDAVDRAQRREAARLRPPGPLQQLVAPGPRDRRRQADANLHGANRSGVAAIGSRAHVRQPLQTGATPPPRPTSGAQPHDMRPDLVVPDVWPADDRLWVPLNDGVWSRPLHFNVTAGQYTHVMRVTRQGIIARHRHTGPVFAHVLKGRWHYLEHDWVAEEGGFAFEPPGETHTLVVPEGCDEMVTLFQVNGALVYVEQDGTAHRLRRRVHPAGGHAAALRVRRRRPGVPRLADPMSDGVLGLFSLRGRGAIVTGAARGLGNAMALALAEAGADIVAVDVEPLAAVSDAITERGVRCATRELDLRALTPEAAADLIAWSAEPLDDISVLVNNAGMIKPRAGGGDLGRGLARRSSAST